MDATTAYDSMSDSGVAESWDYSRQLKIQDEEHAFSLMKARISLADHGRAPLTHKMRRTWYTNLLYYMNLREAFGDASLLHDVDPMQLPHDSIYSANHILPVVNKQVARIAGIAPRFKVTPKSSGPEDIMSAQVGEAVLDHENQTQHWRKLCLENAYWMVLCGTGIIEVDWDKGMGVQSTTYKNPLDGRSMDPRTMDESMRNMIEQAGAKTQSREGELTMRAVSPFELIVPNGPRNLDECQWILLEKEVTPGYIWDRWPEKARYLREHDFQSDEDSTLWKRLRNQVGRHGHSMGSAGDDSSEVVTIRTLWIPPCGWCPTGYVIYSTRSMLLGYEEHPFAAAGIPIHEKEFRHLRFPVSKADCFPVNARFWGMSLVEHLIGPQTQYNVGIDQMMRQRDRMAAPTWLSPRKAELSMNGGDVYEYDAEMSPGKPELIAPPPMGAAQIETAQIALGDMRSIAAQSDPATDFPSQIRSGAGINQIQEEDNLSMGPTLAQLGALYSDTQNRVLTLNWKFAKTERIVGYYGDERGEDVHVFKGEDLHGNVHVRIEPDSMRLRSRAGALELTQALATVGALNPGDPAHAEAIFDSIEFADGQKLFRGPRLWRRRAKHEERLFMKLRGDEAGGASPFPDVEDHDDHVEHLRSHQLFLATDTFENLPPIVKMAFIAHMRKHEQFILEAMTAEQALQGGGAAAGGSQPAPVGEASQPRQAQPTPGPSAGQAQGSFA